MLVSVRNIGARGLVPDIAAHDAGIDSITSGTNIRIRDNAIERAAGWRLVDSPANAVFACPVNQGSAVYLLLLTDSAATLYRTVADKIDVTPSGWNGSGSWSHTQYGDHVVITNGTLAYSIGPSDSSLQPLPLPAGFSFEHLTTIKGHLVAVNMQDGARDLPFAVRWSDTVDPETLATSWDISDPTTLAGEVPLSDAGGELIDAGVLGNAVICYSRSASVALEYIGGQFVFSNRLVFADDGLIYTGAWCEVQGRHFVVGEREIYLHDGSSKTSPAAGRVNRTFYDKLGDPESVRVLHNSIESEVWICYADKDATDSRQANAAWVWNYQNNVWSHQSLPDISAVTVCNRLEDSGMTSWDNLPATWDEMGQSWDSLSPRPGERVPYLLADNALYQANSIYSHAGTLYDSSVVQTKLDLDEVSGNATTVKHLLAIYPQILGEGECEIRFGTSANASTDPKWQSWRTFNIKQDYKLDCRISGRYLAIELRKTDAGALRLTGWDLDLRGQHGR